jgi:choline dehydrogenase-like flavoprotein
MPGMGVGGYAQGYGQALKDSVYRGYGSSLHLALRGEMVPHENCFMDIDPSVKDRWGIPVPRFHWKWGDQELNQAGHGMATGAKIIEAMGGTVNEPKRDPEEALLAGGQIIHEVGTTRMGASKSESVTNQYGQSWDNENLFVMDGGVFASNPHKNCTLTIMTLAMRNATRLAADLKRGAL